VALVANIIAGMLLLPPLGLVLGLIGGRWNESLLGGLLGLTCGMAGRLVLPGMGVTSLASFGLLFGGMMGATLPLIFRLIRRHVFATGR
jgi:hypothetical protein